MVMEQYKEQYKKETEQIHAPAELIAKTKAAMREEEARIHRELALQDTGAGRKGVSARGFSIRKWAYPLTAAAALLILVSVSAMMRGLKSGDMSMSGAPASDTAMESESSAMSGADLDGGMAAAGAAMDMAEGAEVTEEAFADEMMTAEADMAEAPAAESDSISEEMAAVENAVSDTTGFAESAEDAVVESGESKEAEKKFSDTERSMAEEATPAEGGAQSGSAAAESITIEKAAKKPDFCASPDTETHVFKGQTFRVAETEDGWEAYAETKDGGKYVIRGEAEDLETFFEMGYRKLLEQK